jgi:hypothetical protein
VGFFIRANGGTAMGKKLASLPIEDLPPVELDREKWRKDAIEARRMADAASNEEERRFWLRIADEWKLVLDARRK